MCKAIWLLYCVQIPSLSVAQWSLFPVSHFTEVDYLGVLYDIS